MNEFEIITDDGLRLNCREWQAYQYPEDPNLVIILIHGLAEYCARYNSFAQFYNENNIAVVSMDLRGHGLSEGQHGFIPTDEAIFRDIDILIEETKYRYPSCPTILYGHSMGGNLALSYTLNRYPDESEPCPYDAVIVTSPWIRLAGYRQPPRAINSLIQTIGRIRPSLKVPLRFNSRIISRNGEIVDAYNEDPIIRRSATLSLARTMGLMASTLDRLTATFHIPVLIQHGTADSLTSHNASRKFAERGTNIEFKSWPKFYHELHHEPERDEFFSFTLNWIYQQIFKYF